MTDTAGRPDQTRILAVIALAMFMASLDTSIVNIALPTITDAFDTDIGMVSWVVMAYLLVLTGLMLACGRLGDLKGFRRVFIAGFAIFTLGSLLCGFATSVYHLIAFRILQGIGAAAIEAIAPALIAATLPEDRRGWALGIMMTAVSVAIAAGPILGGFLTAYLGWQWVFFVNVPFGIAGTALAIRSLPPDVIPQGRGRFDTPGAALILPALATLLFPLNLGLYAGWTSPLVAGSLLASAILFLLFLRHERRCASPLVDLSLFRSRNFLAGNIAGMLLLMAFAGSEFLLPFYLQMIRGLSTEAAGLLLAVPAIALILAGPAAGKVADRSGSRGLMIGAALLSAATLLLLSRMDAATGLPVIILALALEGIAVGLFMPPAMSLVLGSGGRAEGGIASGVMMTLRNGGAVLGIALLGTLGMGRTAGAWAGPDPAPALLIPGFQAAFLAGMVICLAVAAVSAVVREHLPGPAAPAGLPVQDCNPYEQGRS